LARLREHMVRKEGRSATDKRNHRVRVIETGGA
jgi:hypothetical protein